MDSGNRNTWIVVGVTLLLCMAAFFAAFGVSSGLGSGPNPNGAVTVHAADPTDPTYQEILNKIKIASDPNASAADKKQAILAIGTNLDIWQQKINSSSAKQSDKDDLVTQIGSLKVSLAKISGAQPGGGGEIKAIDPADLTTFKNQLLTVSQGVRVVLYSSSGPKIAAVISTALSVINMNNNGFTVNGVHPIPFAENGVLVPSEKGMDCASFIHYVLETAKVFPPNTTRWHSTEWPSKTAYFTVVRQDEEHGIPVATAASLLLPGDVMFLDAGAGTGHIIMYIGPQTVTYKDGGVTKTATGDVAASDNPESGGPHLVKLSSEYGDGYSVRAILRPKNL